MKQVVLSVLAVALIMPNIVNADEKCSVSCVIAGFAAKNHRSLAAHISPADGACHVGAKSGFPMPDLKCTPGAINPTITVAVLKNPNFRTCCIRDKVESEQDKHRPTNGMELRHLSKIKARIKPASLIILCRWN
jgi:hypothetical protein